MPAPVMCLRTQEEVTLLLRSIHDQISVKTEAVKVYAEGLSALRTGIADKSFIGDYADSNKMIMCLAGTHSDDELVEVVHGRTKIRYSKTNEKVLTGFQMFEEALNKAKKERLEHKAGEVLSESEIETLRVRIRGDPTKRDDVKQQNSTIIQMIVGKLDTSYLSNLRSASSLFKFGSDNSCLLSLIEGLRNFVANPNAEVSPDAANINRDRAEQNLRDLELGMPIQMNHWRMKNLVTSYIENVKRTTSSWSDAEIMRLIVKKLDQDHLFKDIELSWSTDVRYSSCFSLDLFWKILEADFNAYAATRKGMNFLTAWGGEASESTADINQVMMAARQSASGGSNLANSSIAAPQIKSMSTSLKEFDELQKCHNHIRFVMGHTKEPCARGSSCKFAHIWMNKSSSEKHVSSEGLTRAKRAFDRVTNNNNHHRPTRDQAKKLYKQFKGADQGTNAKSVQPASKSVYLMHEEGDDGDGQENRDRGAAGAHGPDRPVRDVGLNSFDESEFDAFYTELLRNEDVVSDEC